MEDWQLESIQLQTNYYETNNQQTWNGIPQEEKILLRAFIGNTLFGIPSSRSQIRAIKHITKSISMRYNTCHISTILIILKPKFCNLYHPSDKILRISDNEGNSVIYMDQYHRVYRTWNEFLSSNRCPYGQICYPSNGIYQINSDGVVQCEFKNTPRKYLNSYILFFGSLLLAIMGITFSVNLLHIWDNPDFIYQDIAIFIFFICTMFIGTIIFSCVHYQDAKKHGRGCCGPTF